MSQYQVGTVSVTNNNNVVTGSGTLWLANISAGDLFTKVGDNVAYTVASVPSDTQITLTGNYGGSTSAGSSYGITIDFAAAGYPLLNDGDLNTAAIYNDAMRLLSNENQSLGTAAFVDLTSPSATIFDDENLNPNVFSGDADDRIILTGIAQSSSIATFYANSSFITKASNDNYSGSFKVFNITQGVFSGTGFASLSLSGASSSKITVLKILSGLSLMSMGDSLELRCDSGAASITLT